MDQGDCTQVLRSLLDLLDAELDPRCRRGVRYPWQALLAVVVSAMLAGCDQTRAMAQWAAARAELLAEFLPLPRGQAPSESTLQRVLRQLQPARLQALLAAAARAGEPTDQLEALALDGKTLRGTASGQPPIHLLGLARQADGLLLGVQPVGRKENEYTASPALLAGYPMAGRVVTGDAMFCQRRLARSINRAGGDWLFAVKANHPAVLDALKSHFADPPGGPHPLEHRSHVTKDIIHGRRERRRLEASVELVDHLDWPGAKQIIRRTCWRTVRGRKTCEQSYWLTSLSADQADAETLERFCRGHWTIENKVHWTRDVTFGEDRCTTRSQFAPLNLALLRNLVRWLLIYQGRFRNLADGRRHYSYYPRRALELLAHKGL